MLFRSDPTVRVAFELLRLPRNIGKSGALNAGLALTRTDWLVSVDAVRVRTVPTTEKLGNEMIRRIVTFLCAGGLATQGTAATDSALATDFLHATDSTGFVTTGWNAAWLARYRDVDHYAAFSAVELDHRQRSLGIERRQRIVGVTWRAIDCCSRAPTCSCSMKQREIGRAHV